MGTIYRVTVTKEVTDDKGGYEGSETLFELGGSAVMLGRIAPAAILDALIADDGMANGPVPPQQQALADRAWDAAMANGTAAGPQPAGGAAVAVEAPKRTRRTKQQIAEDKAREAQQASMQQQAADTLVPPVTAPPAPAEEWRTGPVGGEEAGTSSTPPPGAPGVPYNPFG